MSRQLRMQVRAGDESPRPEESAIVADAVGGEPDVATASARLDDVSDDDLLALYRGHARGSREQTAACEVLVSRCIPPVRACVRPYRASLESAEDLMQVGYLGLTKALHHYDPAFGRGLRAYAAPCITGEIKRHWHELPRREQQILLLRFYGNRTQEQVAGRLGVSQMHVSRLQARALARLRDRLVGPDGSAVGTAEQDSGGDA